jgi:hypothetical protein
MVANAISQFLVGVRCAARCITHGVLPFRLAVLAHQTSSRIVSIAIGIQRRELSKRMFIVGRLNASTRVVCREIPQLGTGQTLDLKPPGLAVSHYHARCGRGEVRTNDEYVAVTVLGIERFSGLR